MHLPACCRPFFPVPAEPSALAPGMPTVAASGLPGYESISLSGMFAPAKTPAAIINRLNLKIVRVLKNADVKERLFNVGVEVFASSPSEFAATIKSDMAKWGKVINDAGIHE
jgi:tripartite-type tricarboxylate transporter receptor subunit TctC